MNGLFCATSSLCLSYASDAYPKRKEADGAMGLIFACNMVGRAGGGLLSTLFPNHLFLALFPAAAILFASAVLAMYYLPEPEKNPNVCFSSNDSLEEDEDVCLVVHELHKPTMWNILIGSLFDNIGTLGLVCKLVAIVSCCFTVCSNTCCLC